MQQTRFEPPAYARAAQELEAFLRKLHADYEVEPEAIQALAETAIEQDLLPDAYGFDELGLPSSDMKAVYCARCGGWAQDGDDAEVKYARVDLERDSPDGMMGSETAEAYFERMQQQETTVLVHASTCKLPDDEPMNDAAVGG